MLRRPGAESSPKVVHMRIASSFLFVPVLNGSVCVPGEKCRMPEEISTYVCCLDDF